MKVYLETFGCQMNRLDSELVEDLLRAAGHEMVASPRRADAVLYNTCSVRQHAEEKVRSRLGAEAQRKQAGKRHVVGVLGCMAQREGEKLCGQGSGVDLLCAPARLTELPELLERASRGERAIALQPDRLARPAGGDASREVARSHDGAAVGGNGADLDALDLARDVARSRPGPQAYVRVMRGCDKFCTYCIVPFVRGPEVSRDPRRIVEEVGRLAGAGVSEITLLGQTVNSYRYDGGGREVRLSDLLATLSPIAGLRRLRFVTSYPTDFGDDLLEAMRDLPNVCEYIHAPAQHGSDAMLRRMGRRYTRREYDELVDRARAIVPGVVLAGDFIVGFPGETDADHAASAELIRRSGYKNSFIFKYSPRPGTAAARKLADDVPDAVKRRRNRELLAVQAEVGLAHHRPYVGREVEVLAEGPSPRARKRRDRGQAAGDGPMQLVGRTRWDQVTVFDGEPALAGRYVRVRITNADALTLFGRIEETGSPG